MIESFFFKGRRFSPSEFDSYKQEHPEEFLPPEPYVPTIEKLRAIAKNRINNSWNNDINTIGMPLQGYDFSVDYGVEDALIWQNSVDFLPEGATEVEVRAVDNSFHTIPIEVYYSVPALQKAYYAQQLQKKWNLQKAIDAATSAEEIETITWESSTD